MSSESPKEHRRQPDLGIYLLVLLMIVVLVGGGVWLWRRYDPFIMDRPEVRESKVVLEAARKRALTEAEFDKTLELLGTDTPVAQLSAIATIEADVARTPTRRDRAITALQQCQKNAAPNVAKAADQAALRLQAPPKEP